VAPFGPYHQLHTDRGGSQPLKLEVAIMQLQLHARRYYASAPVRKREQLQPLRLLQLQCDGLRAADLLECGLLLDVDVVSADIQRCQRPVVLDGK
jgi:hypothetical protein